MKIYCKENKETYELNLICNGVDCAQDLTAYDDTIVYNAETERYETESYESIEWWEEYKESYDFVEDYTANHDMPHEFYSDTQNADMMDDIKAKAEWIRSRVNYYWVIEEQLKGDSFGGEKPYETAEEAIRKADVQWSYLTDREKKNLRLFCVAIAPMDEDGCMAPNFDIEKDYLA